MEESWKVFIKYLCIKDRTPSLYVLSRLRSSNLKNVGSEYDLNELLFTALIALFCEGLIFCSFQFNTEQIHFYLYSKVVDLRYLKI